MMQQQSALVLHVRPYRETSAIVQFMTKDQGRITGVARGEIYNAPSAAGDIRRQTIDQSQNVGVSLILAVSK